MTDNPPSDVHAMSVDGGEDRNGGSLLKQMTACIPSSDVLKDEEWRQRHHILVIGYMVTASIALIVAVLIDLDQGDFDISHTITEAIVAAAPAALLPLVPGRQLQQLTTTTGILIGCGLLVHGTDGLIESHFGFFVTLPLIALYADWRPYLYAVIYVAGTHGIGGTISPESMYNHEPALTAPFTWGLIHAAFIVALSVVMVVHWNFSDRRRLELVDALHDLKDAQSKLVEAQKLESIGSLAAGVAHEINTPIQFVGDNLRFLSETTSDTNRFVQTWLDHREDFVDPQRAMAALEALKVVANEVDLEFALEEALPAVTQSKEGIDRVAQIVLAMKGFSHPRNEIEPNDINGLVSTTITVSRSEWKYVADVDLDLDPDIPAVPVPAGSFNQVLLNLIVNAAHAIEERGDTGDPGVIRISTTQHDDRMVAVSVTDNGCGIPPELQNRIFEQFFTTKEVGRGTGQGLSIAHSLVTGLGGRIEIESEVGTGTTFRILLPSTRSDSDTAVSSNGKPAAV